MDAAASPASSTNRAAEAGSAGSSADSAASTRSSRAELVVKRLIKREIPARYAERGPEGLIEYVKEDQSRVPEVVGALFPDHEEIKDPNQPGDETQASACRTAYLGMCLEAVSWVQWLMFGRDPKDALSDTAVVSSGARGICGAVWGSNDIAYRCRTCEHDPTCAICVPCFKAGDHRNHDYSMIRTTGGCCDCGDVTAWKQNGFCVKHKGPGHVPSLPQNFVVSAAPVLEAVLTIWVSKLEKAHHASEGKPKKWMSMTKAEKVASQTSLAIIKMLLELCCAGESMLSFTAKYTGMKSIGILDALLKTESFMSKHVIESLHELLYKLLGDTNFKHAFALTFISHYPRFMRDSVAEELANPSSPNAMVFKTRDHAVLSNFSVQIFTVPTLTPKLVLEYKLLDILMAALKDFLVACVGEDGRLLVSKSPIIVRLYVRVTEDIRYVMTHFEVAQYVTRHRKDLCKAWLEILAFVQGMHPQRRVTSIHVEEENEDGDAAYHLEVQMATIHSLFVLGAASPSGSLPAEVNSLSGLPSVEDCPDDDDDNMFVRHAKVGRISPKETNDMDTGSTSGADVEMADVANASCAGADESQCTEIIFGVRSRDGRGAQQSVPAVPTHQLIWLISECVSIIDKWLAVDNSRELAKGPGKAVAESGPASVQHRGSLWRGRARGLTRGTARAAAVAEPAAPAATPPAVVEGEGGPGRGLREWLRRSRRPYAAIAILDEDRGNTRASGVAASGTDSADMDVDTAGVSETVRSRDNSGTEWWMCTDDSSSLSRVGQCYADGWPKVFFDVSRQDVSFHIPLHRMLALLLHKALEMHSVSLEPGSSSENAKSTNPSPLENLSTLSQLLPSKYQVPGFAASLMEHPLRLQVLCAQVQAGMWRRNGHPTNSICDVYRTVPWCEDSLELDLLMLQCCAVLAPPEKYADRILSRFGLSEYFNLFLWRPNEYEASLAQEFLVLLIRICTERGFCGLTQKESLRRELIQRLAVADATHSSLLKALPRRLQDSPYLHECLTAVANYRRPSGMQQGKYVLKEECWSELDLYHPRWSPRELQCAEERYLRACKASPVFLQLPRWKTPFSLLQNLGCFVVSGKVHEILHSVFFHAAFSNNPGDSRATEGLLFTALHLLALALDVCSSATNNCEHDKNANVAASSPEGIDSRLPYSGNINPSTFRVSSPKHAVEEENELPPLLARSIHREFVGGAAGSDAGMTEPQSLLSLLVMLLRKYSSGEGVMGTVVETSQYSAGDLIKSLLLKFADLHRGCMYEIESLVPEILHRPSAALNIASNTNSVGDKESEDKQAVTDAEKRKALARERQKAIMAKMKAAQDRFEASLKDENSDREKAEAVSKQTRDSVEVGEGSSEDYYSTPCALCRDTGSSSQLCFLTLVQKSRLLALAQKPTPSWERASATGGVSSSDRGIDGGRNASESGNVEMYTTAHLWNWIQEALGDAATRERLLEGEALLEVFRNGLHPRNPVRLNAVGTPPARAVEPAETEVDEPESNGDNSEIETCPETLPLHPANWWEEDSVPQFPDEWTSSRELNLVTVLAEYVAAVSRERRRQGEREVPRTVEVEVAREGGAIRQRRMTPTRSNLDATVNTGLGMHDTSGVYLSACGHAVHQECLDRYVSSLLQRYYSRALFEGVQIVDPDMGEFLCPVCRRLANSILPAFSGNAIPDNQSRALNPREALQLRSCGVESKVCKVESSSSTSLQLDQAFRVLLNAESLVNKTGFRKAVNTQLSDSIKGALETLAIRLYGLFHPDKDHLSVQAHGRVPQSLHLWDVFRYSLMSSELAARTRQRTTQGSLSGLVVLEEGGDGAKGSILPLLLQAAKETQGQSRQVVLLRSRGLQLLVDSIIHGVTRDPFPEQTLTGSYTSLQQYLEKSQDSADVQFWKRLADPVLIHDPFSSLIWLLFCLPAPLPPEGGPFTVLVHLFYMVGLTQVIAYHGIALASEAEVGSSVPSFVTAVEAALRGAALSPLDDDKSAVPPCPSLDVIRQLTLPYLRQCSLLKKLLSGTGQVLPVARAHLWELSQNSSTAFSRSTCTQTGDCSHEEEEVANELEELDQLETLFAIPPLTSLLTDERLLSIALTWCQHARTAIGKEFHIKSYIPRPVRAVPFKLMELPHLFQDLLQRYVKERCLRCGNIPEKPALCLLCGTLVCAITSRPCSCSSLNKQGECYRHAMACGAGVGVFLMLRRTNILLQRCERQANWPSPYLDAFGEEDMDQRGKPLFLSEERYAALTAMVASHGLDYSSLVLAQTTRQTLF
ncbi:hypothetical protein Mapa_017828 [Marchantia paleacea]|nr:hypothetical protein Mapa_017828 [Marchantia paleacea]